MARVHEWVKKQKCLFKEETYVLLQRWHKEMVAYGSSLHDAMEDAYYASDDWRRGPREAMLPLIENYIDIVPELDEVTVQGLRK